MKLYTTYFFNLVVTVLISICNQVGTVPSVDRYFTELPLIHQNWAWEMQSDQPYKTLDPTLYIYQVEDPNANYVYGPMNYHWDKLKPKPLNHRSKLEENQINIVDMKETLIKLNQTLTKLSEYIFQQPYYAVPEPHSDSNYMTETVNLPVNPMLPYSGFNNFYNDPVRVGYPVVYLSSLPSPYMFYDISKNENQIPTNENQMPTNENQTPTNENQTPSKFLEEAKILQESVATNLTKISIDPITESKKTNFETKPIALRLVSHAFRSAEKPQFLESGKKTARSELKHKRKMEHGFLYHKQNSD